jgi:carnitine-CoA ligase
MKRAAMAYEGRDRTAVRVLRDQVERAPENTLLHTAAGELSRAEVDSRSNRLAHRLRGLGVGPGAHVLLLLENSELYVFAWLALAKLGAVEVPVNTAYRGQLLAHVIESSEAAVLIADAALLENLAPVAGEVPSLRTVLVSGAGRPGPELSGKTVLPLDSLDGDDAPPSEDPAYNDTMALMFTSGTTGPSKGVLVTHAHAYEYASSVRMALQLQEGDTYCAPLPLFHIAGQWAVVYAALMSGGSAVIKERFSVSRFWEDVSESGATVSFLLGAMANFLHGQPPGPSDADNTLTRLLMSPLVPDLDGFRRRFGVEVATAYGSTEANVSIHSDFSIDDPRQCGRVRPGWQVEIVDEDDEPLPAGQSGEIVVRPPEPWLTMRGYLGNPEATVEAYRNCWMHTGDIAYRDEQGNFYFVDRKHDAIRRRGENISSFEVEREVNAHPGVLESAAVGVSSEHTEQEILVCAVPREGEDLDPAELCEYLSRRAPRFMVPRYVRVLRELPKTDTGKIQKAALREQGTSEAWDAETAGATA